MCVIVGSTLPKLPLPSTLWNTRWLRVRCTHLGGATGAGLVPPWTFPSAINTYLQARSEYTWRWLKTYTTKENELTIHAHQHLCQQLHVTHLTTRARCCTTHVLVDVNVSSMGFIRLPQRLLIIGKIDNVDYPVVVQNCAKKKEYVTVQTWETWDKASASSFWLMPHRLATLSLQ